MSERTETEIKKCTKEQAYFLGYNDCKGDVLLILEDIKAELVICVRSCDKCPCYDCANKIDARRVREVIDKHIKGKSNGC